MKKLILAFFIISTQFFAQNTIETVELNDIAYPVLTLTNSKSLKYMFVSLYGGRFLMYDVSASENTLTKNSKLIWKNFNIKGFEKGGNCSFSANETMLLVTEYNFYNSKAEIKSVNTLLIDALSGATIYEEENINSAQLINNDSQLLIAKDDGVKVYDIATKKIVKEQKIENCEVASLSHNNSLLAVSFDPSRREFQKIESIGTNSKEVKNAVKNKKLIAFYDFASGKKLGTSNDEVDVVHKIDFTTKDDYIILLTKNNSIEQNKGKEQINFIRINLSNFKIDNLNFYYSSSEIAPSFIYNSSNNYFACNDNEGFFEWKKKVSIYDFNELNKKVASFMFQGRPVRKNLFPTVYCFTNNNNMLVSNGTKVMNWNYAKYPEYIDYVEKQEPDAIADSASTQIQRDVNYPESKLMKEINKNQIKGLYIFDLTITKNGEVSTIFASSDDKTNIQMQNKLKEILLKYNFDVKVPKNERVKIRQVFNFN